MPTVHVFTCTDRFRSFEEMRAFIDPTYTEDDAVAAPFKTDKGNEYTLMIFAREKPANK